MLSNCKSDGDEASSRLVSGEWLVDCMGHLARLREKRNELHSLTYKTVQRIERTTNGCNPNFSHLQKDLQ